GVGRAGAGDRLWLARSVVAAEGLPRHGRRCRGLAIAERYGKGAPIDMTDRILILDFGSQVTQLIARRVREHGVYCEIWPFNTDPQRIAAFAPRGIIFSGGPASVTVQETPRAPQVAFDLKVPI